MKKLALTIALFSITILTFAGPGLGIKGGANFANQSAKIFDVDISTSGITGFVGGVYAHWFFGDKIAIQPELLWARKGAELEDPMMTSQTATAKLNYFDIPIVVKWQFIKFLNIHAGPQFSVLTKAVMEDGTDSEDIKEDLKNSDWGLIVGAEANLPLRLNVTARYIFGLKDISDISEIELKNSTFQLTLGIRLIGN
jgi:hypothetical protein